MQQRNQIGLAVALSHPVQYYSPVFKEMAQMFRLKVFYTGPVGGFAYDKGFRQKVKWDIPLLEGYEYEFVNTYKLLKKIKEFNPDQLLIYGWAHYSHLKLMIYFKGKLIINFRGDSTLLSNPGKTKRILKKMLLTWIYKHIDRAFYVGTQNKYYFTEYGVNEAQLIFAPHSIDNIRFSNIKESKPIRLNLAISETSILILYAGKFDQNKNPELLLQAFIELNLTDTHLLFAGSGILENKLKAKIKSYKNVHFLPFQNQMAMPALYQACDLFCLPTKNDSWGLSINEAMAAGKAILSSDKAGAAIDLIRKENGQMFISEDLDDLKYKLRELATSRSQLQAKGKYSANFIKEWSIEIQVKNITTCLYSNH